MPLRLLAAILSRIRSPVTSRSYWAKDRGTLSIKRPRVALENALVYHPKSGVVETVVKGGAKNHAAILTLFAKHLAKTELKPEAITPSRFKLSVLNDGLLAPKEDWSTQGIQKVRLRRAKFTPADQRSSAIQIEASPEVNREDAICVAREELKVAHSFDSEFEMDRATLMVYTRDQNLIQARWLTSFSMAAHVSIKTSNSGASIGKSPSSSMAL